MKLIILIVLTVLIGIVYGETVEKRLSFGKELVDHVNGLKGSTFKARRYPQHLEDRFKQNAEFLAQNINQLVPQHKLSKREIVEDGGQIVSDNEPIPTSFDISEKWPQCASVFKRLIDQGTCRSGTNSVGITGLITDRRCIRSNGTSRIPISAWDMITCCETIQCKSGIDMCDGTSNLDVFQQYLDHSGIATGGALETEQFRSHGCKPWPLTETTDYKTVNKTCDPKCRPEYKERSYSADKRKGRGEIIQIVLNTTTAEEEVQREIMNRGSVMLFVFVGSDFFQYSSGVYQNINSDSSGYYGSILLRIQGWGVDENGVKYWRGPFTFGRNWGEQGYFRIIRGKYSLNWDAQAIQTVRAYND